MITTTSITNTKIMYFQPENENITAESLPKCNKCQTTYIFEAEL